MRYVGETGKLTRERIKQPKDDVRLERDRNTIYKQETSLLAALTYIQLIWDREL